MTAIRMPYGLGEQQGAIVRPGRAASEWQSFNAHAYAMLQRPSTSSTSSPIGGSAMKDRAFEEMYQLCQDCLIEMKEAIDQGTSTTQALHRSIPRLLAGYCA